nr:fructoselysine 3-epimerase [uncultured Mediterraneibacter sp.]
MLKVGMFTSGYQRNPLEHCFMDAKEYGYDYIELWGGRPHAYAPDLKVGDINEVRRLIEKYEMPVLGYTPEHNAYPYNYMIGSEAQRRDAVDYLKLSLEMAKEMGAEFVLTSPANGGYLATYDQLWSRLEKNIQELGDYAAKLEIKLVVEALTPYESNFFTRANDLVELFRRVDNPYVVGMCDIVPPFVQHESIMAYFDKLGNKMDHMHIIDGENGSDTHMIPGEGNIPIKEMLYEMKRIGYDKTATLELVTNYINEPRFYAKRAIDNMRELMAEAGIV